MTKNERLNKVFIFLKNERLVYTQRDFSDIIGQTPSVVSEMLNNKRDVSEVIVRNICNKFNQINYVWILTGEGNMLKEEKEEVIGSLQLKSHSDESNTIPLLPISAQGGTLNDFVLSITADECERVISPIKNIDFAMNVSGESMSPEYPSGSQILIKKINERAFIDWGRVYVLDTCNGSVIKKIMPSTDNNKVKCVSVNPEYPPFEVSMDDIYGVYRVMLCMASK